MMWLLHFDEQLASSMAHVLNTPFSPYGILGSLRMELNIAFMEKFERRLAEIKGKRVAKVAVEFKPKKSKLMIGAQQFFADHVVRRHEAQTKLAVHFNRQERKNKTSLLLAGEAMKPVREARRFKDVQQEKKERGLPTMSDLKSDISLQLYTTHDISTCQHRLHQASSWNDF